ncbi:MAG: LON peptidase substrate-binding domain-containing protein [Trueperaceae bacterium]|nr:LON peptidase substrate-binding domain-containing protein [Trueperaceae bacterium]
MAEVPVFPLDLVVFPGQTVPLVVFEARYKRLVKAVLELDEPRFVIARARPTADGPAMSSVGTVVRVVELAERPDGTYTMTGHGGERVRVDITRREDVPESDGSERPLFFTEAEPVPVVREDPNLERVAAWDALEAFRRYARTFFAADAEQQVDDHVPDEPLYQASFVCANLRLEGDERQALLEAPSLVDRFRLAERLIEERLEAHAPGLGDAGAGA